MTIHLYLVRHGETHMNRASQLQGITDAPLTTRGHEQIQALGAALQTVPFTQAYSSDRQRAVTTAQAILDHQQNAVPLTQLAGLREYYFGGLEGMKNLTLMRRSIARYGVFTMTRAWATGDRFAQLIRNFQRLDQTGQAESLAAIRTRVQAVQTRIVANASPDARVLVVAHGVILSAWIDAIDAAALPGTLLKNATVTRVDVTADQAHIVGVNLTGQAAATV